MDQSLGPVGAPQKLDTSTYRLFSCHRCRVQCLICSPCDRGNIYCLPCASKARSHRLKSAQRRYRKSKRGKAHHARAERARRARRATSFVGDHGSTSAVLAPQHSMTPTEELEQKHSSGEKHESALCCDDSLKKGHRVFRCQFCSAPLSPWARRLGEATRAGRFLERISRKRGQPP